VGKAARRKTERRVRKMGKLMLTITLEEDGRIEVTGPIDNKVLCYGMLELARQTVQAYELKILTPKTGTLIDLNKGA